MTRDTAQLRKRSSLEIDCLFESTIRLAVLRRRIRDMNSQFKQPSNMKLILRPNNGVGLFKIGQSLYETMKIAQSLGSELEFKYSSLNLISVVIKSLGITLFYDSYLQILLFIEIILSHDDGKPEFYYQNIHVKEFTFKNIYNRHFGPTFPGEYDANTSSYYLSYCGISFIFSGVNSNESTNEKLNTNQVDRPCSRFIVYQDNEKESWLQFSSIICGMLNSELNFRYISSMRQFAHSIDHEMRVKYVNLPLISGESLTFYCESNGKTTPISVKVGETSLQSMVRVFGLPNNSITKKKNRTNTIQLKSLCSADENLKFSTSRNYLPVSLIDNTRNLGNLLNPKRTDSFLKYCTQETIKIHNYFDHGFDVIYDMDSSYQGSNIVSRIIIHQNAIESTEFLKYKKLPIIYAEEKVLSTMREIKNQVELTGFPVFLDRKEYHIHESDDEYNEDFEIIDNEREENPLLKEKSKYWGLSNYDGCKVAIWESLISSDEICSVTILE